MAYITTTADITITGITSGDHSGYDVNVGDLNGDDYDDIIISAPYADGNHGQVYVVYGGPRASISDTTPLSQADLTVSGAMTDTWLGSSVYAGDLNHDGTDDLLMGAIGIAPWDADRSVSGSTTEEGAAYVLLGSSLSGTVDLSIGNPSNLTVLGASADDWLGRGLGVGDLNGDGFNELLVGAAGLDHGSSLTDTGAAYLINLVYPQQITVAGSLTQVVAGNIVSFSATARTWLDIRDVTSQTSFAISPAASGSWTDNTYSSEIAGTWIVTATYEGALTDTTTLIVNPANVDSFAFNTIGAQTAGVSFPITVTAHDAYGNVATGFTGSATLSDSTGTVSPTVTLRVSDGDGGVTTDTTTISVDNVAPVIDAGGPYIATIHEVITFTVTITDVLADSHTVEWDLDQCR